jgi:hypothetical protein
MFSLQVLGNDLFIVCFSFTAFWYYLLIVFRFVAL